jgi:Predicted metal-dependent hydrolase
MHRENERLTEIMSNVGKTVGFPEINASFIVSKDFKISWKRRGQQFNVMISDYIADAPDRVLIDLSETIMDIVRGRPYEYGKEYLEWVTSDEFISDNRKTYIRRSKNITRDPVGKERDLIESVDRLLDSSLLTSKDIQNSFFSWTVRPNYRKVGYCSPMMRVVAVSSALDHLSVPDYVVDFVVYHESLHLRQGYRPSKRAHDPSFRKEEDMFPRRKEAEKYLNDLKNKI